MKLENRIVVATTVAWMFIIIIVAKNIIDHI